MTKGFFAVGNTRMAGMVSVSVADTVVGVGDARVFVGGCGTRQKQRQGEEQTVKPADERNGC